MFTYLSDIIFYRGCRCPERNVLTQFVFDSARGVSSSKLYSMFRFPDSNTVHLQVSCDWLRYRTLTSDWFAVRSATSCCARRTTARSRCV